MSLELILGLLALFGTAAIGTPVAYSIIVGVVVYLGVSGQDIAIAGETMVQRLFDGFLLLAPPSQPRQQPSARSFRPPSRWCCMRLSRTPRSAACFWQELYQD